MSEKENLVIFISHSHKDKEIADIFRETIEDWSSGSIKIVQSSYGGAGMAIGEELEQSVKKAISESSIVLLIYTGADKDWAWCMYECGLASDPTSQDSTRIVVFQSADNIPGPLKNLTAMKMSNEESIKQFIIDLHRKEDFFSKIWKSISAKCKR